jgi:hypothetical protein
MPCIVIVCVSCSKASEHRCPCLSISTAQVRYHGADDSTPLCTPREPARPARTVLSFIVPPGAHEATLPRILHRITMTRFARMLTVKAARPRAPGHWHARSEERTRTHHIKRVRTSADFLVPVIEEASCTKRKSHRLRRLLGHHGKTGARRRAGGRGGHLSRKIFRRTCHCRGTGLSGSTCRFHRTPPR